MGARASGSDGQPGLSMMGGSNVYTPKDKDTADVKKTAFVSEKTEQKGKLSMDPMMESSWKSKDCSALAEESILLVAQSTDMPSTTLGAFAPQTARVGQMKLEAPP